MRSGTSFWLAATMAVLGLGAGSPEASAWNAGWGSRYSPAYYGPPVHLSSPPAVVYPGPPVYAYSYLSPDRGSSTGYYTARINVFRGPRWDYSAAYYGSPSVRRVAYSRQTRRSGVRRFCPPYRAYIRGPILTTSRIR